MKEQRLLVALGALSAALAACSSEINEPGTGNPSVAGAGPSATAGSGPGPGPGPNPGTGGSISNPGTGGTNSGPGPNPGTGGTAPQTDPNTCIQGIPATTQLPRMLNRHYDAVVQDLLGVTTIASAQNKPPSGLLFADFEGPMTPDAWRLYQEVAEKIAVEVLAGPNRTKFISCDPAMAGCLKQTIQTFGRKAFRRPLTEAEVTRFEKLGQTTPAGTPAEVTEATLIAFLVSPSFILLPELQPTAEGAAFKLSSHEVATRLSFLLWGSVPDATLDMAADMDQLQTKEQVLAQATRMIAIREKTGPLIAAMHRRYLDMDSATSHWWKVQHDKTKFPLYDTAQTAAYQAELDAFFEEVAFTNGSFKDIFLSNVGFVNQATAPIYGLNAMEYGPELKRTELTDRPGFLTRVGFLSSFSRFEATSPILRGAFITVNLLGTEVPPPPPDAQQVPAPPGDYKTERAYIEALTGQTSCTGCHTQALNPPGFVLEKYDSIGKVQENDLRGGPINTVATVTFASGVSKQINNPQEMMEEIAKTAKARRIYAEKWVSFAYGRSPNSQDACVVQDLDTKLSQDGYSVLKLLGDLTQADSFRLRVKGN